MGRVNGGRYVLISSDAHAGAAVQDYKTFLAREFYDEFDRWAADFNDPWSELDVELAEGDPNLLVGVASAMSPYNWDSAKRIEHMDSQGIAAEVVFPNTIPPFYPSGYVTAGAPTNAEEYRLRWAGVQAHNRWLAEFCAAAPGRRGGLAQVFLNNMDDAVAEVRRAKDDGLVGIVIPGDHMTQLVPLYEPRLDPLWAVCADLEMPVHRHAIAVQPPQSDETGPGISAIGAHETYLFLSRGMAHMVWSGAFERHPNLRFVLTECGLDLVIGQLRQMQYEYIKGQDKGTSVYPNFHRAIEHMTKTPIAYFEQNCFVGTSLLVQRDLELRHEVGVDKVMWGADYPHHEGTFPHTTLALRINFSEVPEDEVRAMTSENAAALYGFDLDHLQRIADEIGPSVEDVARPVAREELPLDTRSTTIGDALERQLARL
jgi:predicted TIM-barrel fold metal-dependent hydrolase